MNTKTEKHPSTPIPEQAIATVHRIIAEQVDVPLESVTPEARIMEDLGADSLDVMEIVMRLEETFNITIPDDEVENAPTVGELYQALAKLTA